MRCTFKRDKTTKTKIRYTATEGPIIGSVYLELGLAESLGDELVIEVK